MWRGRVAVEARLSEPDEYLARHEGEQLHVNERWIKKIKKQQHVNISEMCKILIQLNDVQLSL